MSVQNVSYEMENGTFAAPNAIPVLFVNVSDPTYDKLGMYGYVTGATAVSLALTAGNGYAGKFAKGCLMIDTTDGTVYQNKAAASVPSFALNSSVA